MTSPGTIEPGGLFPLVANQCVYDTYWNSSAQPPAPTINPLTGQAYLLVLQAFDDKPVDPCKTFQWSSLLTDKNDVNTFRDLVEDRNPVELSIGDKIWIEPGSKTTLFDTVDDCSAANDKSCEYVTLPMVTSIAAHADLPISSFACAKGADLKPAGAPSQAEVPTCAARPGATRSRSCGHVRPRFPMAVAGSRR